MDCAYFSLNEDQADMIYFKGSYGEYAVYSWYCDHYICILLFYMLLYSYKRYFDEVLSELISSWRMGTPYRCLRSWKRLNAN